MNKVLTIFAALFTLTLASNYAWPAIDVYEFQNDEQREDYRKLIRELRCPKCQNQDISDSNAPIATDMRREVHRLVLEGKEHDYVVNFMIERFGDFVTYKPRFDSSTLLLWLGPFVVVILGLMVTISLARAKKVAAEDSSSKEAAVDKSQIDVLLNKYDDENDSNGKP